MRNIDAYLTNFGAVYNEVETAGTPFVKTLPPIGQQRPFITNVSVSAAAGATEDFTALQVLDKGIVDGEVAAAGTDVVLSESPDDTPEASDYVLVQLQSGNWHTSTVSSWTEGTLTLVLNTAVPAEDSILDGSIVYLMGQSGDHECDFTIAISGELSLGSEGVVGAQAGSRGEPLIIYFENAEARLVSFEYAYMNK